MAAVRDHGQPLVEDPARLDGVEALGLDETVMLHAGPRRRTTYVTGFVDLHGGRLLDIALGRSGSVVETWLAERDENWLAGIDVVALDPFRGYANGLLAQLPALPPATTCRRPARLSRRSVSPSVTARWEEGPD